MKDRFMEKEIQPQMLKLAQQARLLFEKEKLYTDPLMNRKKLANLLRTNEKYLADAIRLCEGLTVNDFINIFRIKHARRLLEENQQLTALSIAIESGISTRITLFRLFRRYYNMSPSAFKKQIEK